MICWYCHWGWAKPVFEIYKQALSELNGDFFPLNFGPAHVVWEDENFDSAEWCLSHLDEYRGDCTDIELSAVRRSLEKLAALPLDVRCIVPDDYDDEHPELFPPSVEVVKPSSLW